MAELEAIFAAGEPFDARLSAYERNASQGLTIEPLDAETVTTTILAGDLATVDDETVEGPLCILNTYRSASASGGESQDGLAHPGQVTAVRFDGVWKIQRVDVDDTQSCDPEASA
jgi:hypothetical protein